MEFTEEGRVELRLRRERDTVVFEVADTGPGIAPESRDRILRPFEQAEAGPTRTKGGTGLGLSVSVELARLLGGSLSLESEVGRGSTFSLTLPRQAERTASNAPGARPAGSPASARRRHRSA